MTGDLFGGLTGRTDDPETLAALEVDYTPPAIAVQCLLALRAELDASGVVWSPRLALDPAAGSGCWGRAMRAVLPAGVCLAGVEPRESEVANLAAYDVGFSVTLSEFMQKPLATRAVLRAAACGDATTFDLIATNPPFSAFEPEGFWPLKLLEAGLLHAGSIVGMLGLSQWGQSAEAVPMLRCWAPMLQLRLGGRPAFRASGQTDAREYSLWVWSCADGRSRPMGARPSWRTVQLPTLPTGLRRWAPTAVPGTYPIEPALVAEIQERYL